MNQRIPTEAKFSPKEKIWAGILGAGFAIGALAVSHDIIQGGDLHGEKVVNSEYGPNLDNIILNEVDISGNCDPSKVRDHIMRDERNQLVLEDMAITGSEVLVVPQSCD